MATTAVPVVRLSGERRFFLGMAAALAACTFAGFAQTYFLLRWTGAPSLEPIVHLHGVLFTAWVLLFGLQAGLISARRHDIHAITGLAAIVLAAAIVVLGIIISVSRSRPPALSPLTNEQFLIMPIVTIGLFALFVTLAFLNRHRPDYHKRYMLLATIHIVIPALARMTLLLPVVPRGVVGALLIVDLFLIALARFDWRTLGGLHRATLVGGLIAVISQPLRFMIAQSDWWPGIARSLLV